MSDRHRSARYAFAASSLAPDLFHVLRFEGEEAVSQPYRFTVHLLSDDPDIEFSDLIDKPATLTLFRGDDPAELNGIVVDFQQAEKRDGQSEYRFAYTAVLAPRLWRLALSFQSRIFQNLTVEEIVSKVLTEAGVDFAFELQESYEPREYCTQYKETDLQFVQRLLEFEGIRYCFKHDGGTETLLLTDTGDAPPIVDGEEVAYRDQGGLLSAESVETVGGFVARQQLVTGTTAVKDYNYRTPAEPLQSESALDTAQAVGTQSDFGMHLTTPKRADRIALVRNQEIESGRRVMNGKGDCLRFRSGHRFALAEHYRDSFNQKYVLTHVRHEGSNEGADGAGEEGGPPDYRNTFVCVPAGVAYRPPRLTPEPKLPGVLTAKVESGGGTYAPIDDQGRYRVRMPFDLGDAGAAQATKPVRLAQPYTGPGYGQHFPVHKEAEMVIACVDGNVDRILGLSTIYNPSQFSPVTSDNAAQNVLRSWGQNELTFDDTQGAEEIYMHATKDHRAQIVNDQQSDVGNNRSQLVGTNETLTVGQDQTEDIGRDRTLAVGANESITVSANRSMTVGASLTESVGASMSLTVATTKDEAVGVASTLTIGAAYVVSVGAAKTESIGGASAETVGGSKSLTVGSDASTNAGGSLQLTAGKDYALSVGKKATLTIADDAVVQAGKNVTIQAGKKAVIEVADQLTLKCGKAEIVLKKNGDISIKGGKIDVKGSGKMTLKGSQIAQN